MYEYCTYRPPHQVSNDGLTKMVAEHAHVILYKITPSCKCCASTLQPVERAIAPNIGHMLSAHNNR